MILLAPSAGCSASVEKVYQVTESGSAEELGRLLKRGAEIGSPSEEKYPLRLAVELGQLESIGLLLEHGSDVDFSMSDGTHVIDYLVRNNRIDILGMFIDYGSDPNYIIKIDKDQSLLDKDQSLLYWSVLNMVDKGFVAKLIKAGADFDYNPPHTERVKHTLFAAIYKYTAEELSWFLSFEPDIYVKENDYYTTLKAALNHRKPRSAIALLEHGYDLSKENFVGLYFSIVSKWTTGSKELADMITEAGYPPDLNLPLLHSAAGRGNYGAAKWLLEHGFSPTRKYPDAHTYGRFVETAIDQYFGAHYRLTQKGHLADRLEEDDPVILEMNRVYELMLEYVEEEQAASTQETPSPPVATD